jgi:hypothetical protein
VLATSSDSRHSPENALDGNIASYWSPAANTENEALGLEFDFAAHVDEVTVNVYSWHYAPTAVTVEMSTDGSLWVGAARFVDFGAVLRSDTGSVYTGSTDQPATDAYVLSELDISAAERSIASPVASSLQISLPASGFSDEVALGMVFPYYSQNYSAVRVSSSGLVLFSDATTEAASSAIVSSLPRQRLAPLIAPYWTSSPVAEATLTTVVADTSFALHYDSGNGRQWRLSLDKVSLSTCCCNRSSLAAVGLWVLPDTFLTRGCCPAI